MNKEKELEMAFNLAKMDKPKSVDELPNHVLIVAYVLSELKIGFQIGFLLFLPLQLLRPTRFAPPWSASAIRQKSLPSPATELPIPVSGRLLTGWKSLAEKDGIPSRKWMLSWHLWDGAGH
jgi:hypothetical protein